MKRTLTLWFVAGFSISQAGTLWWGPYLQDVGGDRASVLWATRGDDGSPFFRYASRGSAPRSVAPRIAMLPAERTGLGESVFLHRVDLQALSPATEYTYEIQLNGQPAAADRLLTFRTSGAAPFRFLVLGDSGDNGTPQRQLAQYLVQEAGSFLIHAGDMAYFEGQFQQMSDYFFAIYAALLSRTPLFTAPGNHDYPSDAFAYRTLFTPPANGVPPEGQGRYYSFDWGNAHFVALDTNTPLELAAQGTGAMLDWLERDLRATRQTWRIVYFHHPPFPSTVYKLDDPLCALALKYVTPILERHAVHLVFSGHEHLYQRTKLRRNGEFSESGPGTTYITTGGGGSQIYEPGKASFIAVASGASHFLRIDVGEATLKGEAVGPSGESLDHWSLSAAPVLMDPPALDAAAFRAGIAPGGLISIFGWNFAPGETASTGGTLPRELGGTKVLIDGVEAPLLFATRMQLNAQLPFELSASPSLEIRSPYGLASKTLKPDAVAPAIFTVPSGKTRVAAALHADGRLIDAGNPASAGEWIAVYLTGLGRVKGAIAAGEPAPSSPLFETEAVVRAQIAGWDAEVAIACLAPGFAGLYQVNLRVPAGLEAGPRKVQVIAGGVASNAPDLPLR